MTSIELAHPHDHLTRRFLIDPELMADLLAYYPQKATDQALVRLLDLKQLECKSPVSIDKNLVQGIGDLRFTTSFKGSNRQSNVFLLFEHQSKIDQRMRLRGLNYIVQAFNQFEDANKGKKKLPYPVVVVLYHGKVSWMHLLDMDDLIEIVPGAESGLLKYILIVIDISVIPKEKFRGHPALQALLEALQSASEGKLVANFDRITGYFTPIKNDPRTKGWLHSLGRYAMSVGKIGTDLIAKAYSKVFNEKEAQEMAMTTAQELLLEGEIKGRAEGRVEGRVEEKGAGLLRVLTARFQTVPRWISDRVSHVQDGIVLDSLMVAAATCQSIQEFEKELR